MEGLESQSVETKLNSNQIFITQKTSMGQLVNDIDEIPKISPSEYKPPKFEAYSTLKKHMRSKTGRKTEFNTERQKMYKCHELWESCRPVTFFSKPLKKALLKKISPGAYFRNIICLTSKVRQGYQYHHHRDGLTLIKMLKTSWKNVSAVASNHGCDWLVLKK